MKKNGSHVSIEVCHRDMCRACMPTPIGLHSWTLVLDEKFDGGTISVFSYTTRTKFDKK